jgi:hypothetical protein
MQNLTANRTAKLERARELSRLTIPSVLPHSGWNENTAIISPASSGSGQAVTYLASKIHAAMIPLNDIPFVELKPLQGVKPSIKATRYLEDMTKLIHEQLLSKNLREEFYEALIHLIIVGDVLVYMGDDYTFSIYRLDQYTVIRNADGTLMELIVIDYELKPETLTEVPTLVDSITSDTPGDKQGYTAVYSRYVRQSTGKWKCYREKNGESVNLGDKDTYDNFPFVALRWSAIAGENYGRSHCELLYGDILADEEYTKALQNGMVAASAFWMAVGAESGMANIDDVAGKPVGEWFTCANPDAIKAVSPAETMNPQVKTMMEAVQMSRERIGKAFLQTGQAIPTGDRVTATAIRAIGIELEQVLGGTFSAIARDFFVPIVSRTVDLLIRENKIDPKFHELVKGKGILKYDIVTGLQAIGRESDLNKVMQFFEVARNLPEQALQTIKWNVIMEQALRSMGWKPEDFVYSEQEIQAKMDAANQAAMAQQQQLSQQEMIAKSMPGIAQEGAKAAFGANE